MATEAKVRSIDALEQCRSSLIVFLTKARRGVDMVADEVKRTRQWLNNDQMLFWENQCKRRLRALEQAQQELMTARLSQFHETLNVRQMAVRKAKRFLEEAEEKLKKTKLWCRNFDNQAAPMVKRLESLRQFLEFDLPKAVHYLAQQQKTLDAYAQTVVLNENPGAAPSSPETPAAQP
jgi:beta-galactosidase/beta-glucuronidase